jgi:metallo-beta-lactamase family protein
MAIDATAIYAEHTALHDADARRLWKAREGRLLPRLQVVRSGAQSQSLNEVRSGLVIIAGSGMCEGGRIRHHLKHNLWRPECHVVIVGYQAEGTVGRQLVDGHAYVRLWGEPVRVAASVHTIGGMSAHADQRGLMEWYGAFASRPPVCLVHGEGGARAALAAHLREAYGADVHLPEPGTVLDLHDPRARAAA